MKVHCPHCATTYELPERLLGTAGARVRCPRCAGAFEVDAEGRPRGAAGPPDAPEGAHAAHAPVAVAPAAPPTPLETARAVIEELAGREGAGIEDAISRGRLFAEHGARLVEAYDAYRRRAGRDADAAAFRQALRERWGVELTPHWGEGAS